MDETSSDLQLKVGDRVIYPNQGVCEVFGVESKEIAGQTLTFVNMRREEDGAVLMVPEPKLLSVGVRRLAGPDEAKVILTFLKESEQEANLDWKQRARANAERMSRGGLMDLAEVVKELQMLSELRPLPPKERNLYDNARHLLVREMSEALGLSEVDAEDAFDLVLYPPGAPKRQRAAPTAPADDIDALLAHDELGLEGSDDSDGDGRDDEGDEAPAKPAPKKRGRPPKAKAEDAEPATPKKRGRPPKAKPADAEAAAPKKRGRPPKAKPADAETAAPKKRGRPRKNPLPEGGES